MTMHYWINLYKNAVRAGVEGTMAFAKAVGTAASGCPASMASVVKGEGEMAAAVASATDVLTTTLEGMCAADEVSERFVTLVVLALAIGFVFSLSTYQLMQKFVIGKAGSAAEEYPNCTTEPASRAAHSEATNNMSDTIGPEPSPTTMDTPVIAPASIQLTPPLTHVPTLFLSTEQFLGIGPGLTHSKTENHNPGPTPSLTPTLMAATESSIGCTMPSPHAQSLEPKILRFESAPEQSPVGEGTSMKRAAANRTDIEETSKRDVNWNFLEKKKKRKLVALEDKEEILRTETPMNVEPRASQLGMDTTQTKPKEKSCDGSENQTPLFRTVYDVDEQTTLRVLVSSDEQKKRLESAIQAFARTWAKDVATESTDWEKSEGRKRKAAEGNGNEREGIAIKMDTTLTSNIQQALQAFQEEHDALLPARLPQLAAGNPNAGPTSSKDYLSSIEWTRSKGEPLPLPKSFAPGPLDVLFARGSRAVNHVGNKKLRDIVRQKLPDYSAAKTRIEKRAIVTSIVDAVRDYDGGFVKQDKNGRWYDVGVALAREKIVQCIRDQRRPRSSAASNGNRRRRW